MNSRSRNDFYGQVAMKFNPPCPPRQIRLPRRQWHLGTAGIQKQDHSCWTRPR